MMGLGFLGMMFEGIWPHHQAMMTDLERPARPVRQHSKRWARDSAPAREVQTKAVPAFKPTGSKRKRKRGG